MPDLCDAIVHSFNAAFSSPKLGVDEIMDVRVNIRKRFLFFYVVELELPGFRTSKFVDIYITRWGIRADLADRLSIYSKVARILLHIPAYLEAPLLISEDAGLWKIRKTLRKHLC
jgi:hypothetical protein